MAPSKLHTTHERLLRLSFGATQQARRQSEQRSIGEQCNQSGGWRHISGEPSRAQGRSLNVECCETPAAAAAAASTLWWRPRCCLRLSNASRRHPSSIRRSLNSFVLRRSEIFVASNYSDSCRTIIGLLRWRRWWPVLSRASNALDTGHWGAWQ